MTSHVVRLYALATTIAVFFVLWAAIAARPWQEHGPARDPRLNALAVREQRLHPWRRGLVEASGERSTWPPDVQLTTLAPVTETRSS